VVQTPSSISSALCADFQRQRPPFARLHHPIGQRVLGHRNTLRRCASDSPSFSAIRTEISLCTPALVAVPLHALLIVNLANRRYPFFFNYLTHCRLLSKHDEVLVVGGATFDILEDLEVSTELSDGIFLGLICGPVIVLRRDAL
jgi:hypothetical protein